MATVYKAMDKVLKRNVAVKILRDEFTTDEEFIKRFEVEAQSAARLTHPNIVSIYDVGVDGNLYFIVMELIKGKTLKEIIIEEEGPLPWKWSVNVAIQIASALEMAHRNNIIHRDIKPHNIIITEDGIAKVTDFGIAKAVSNSTITAFGTTIGSVHYFSPEHARGGYTDAKSDIYSLGVVMYEMVTGQVPFDADTPVSVALKHMQEDPKEPIELNDRVPEAVNKIIMKALKKDSNLRYQSATEMLEDLKTSLKDPEGDFVEEIEDDPTARTQVIDTSAYGNATRKNNSGKKDNKFKKFIREHKKLSIFIGIILLFALAFGGTMGILAITNPAEVEMPNVVGLSKDEAKQDIENAKLKFTVDKEEYNKDVPEGYVISQNPTYQENHNKVKEGSEVKVVISKGQEKVTVIKVIGMKKDEAVKALESLQLKVEIVEETNKKVEEGYVISQDTEANTEVYAGDTVKIHVSTGVEKATVPNVEGKSQADAKSTLEALGFVVTVKTSEDSSKESGIVLSQSLSANSSVEKGSAITITVNSYIATKTITVTGNIKDLIGIGNNNTNNTDNTTVSTSVSIEISINGTVKVQRTKSITDKISEEISGVKNGDKIVLKISGAGSYSKEETVSDSSTINFK